MSSLSLEVCKQELGFSGNFPLMRLAVKSLSDPRG